jgi:hypothetical protein
VSGEIFSGNVMQIGTGQAHEKTAKLSGQKRVNIKILGAEEHF